MSSTLKEKTHKFQAIKKVEYITVSDRNSSKKTDQMYAKSLPRFVERKKRELTDQLFKLVKEKEKQLKDQKTTLNLITKEIEENLAQINLKNKYLEEFFKDHVSHLIEKGVKNKNTLLIEQWHSQFTIKKI